MNAKYVNTQHYKNIIQINMFYCVKTKLMNNNLDVNLKSKNCKKNNKTVLNQKPQK